jgi:hypothetical protein
VTYFPALYATLAALEPQIIAIVGALKVLLAAASAFAVFAAIARAKVIPIAGVVGVLRAVCLCDLRQNC